LFAGLFNVVQNCGDRKDHNHESLPLKLSRQLAGVLIPGYGDDGTSLKIIGSQNLCPMVALGAGT